MKVFWEIISHKWMIFQQSMSDRRRVLDMNEADGSLPMIRDREDRLWDWAWNHQEVIEVSNLKNRRKAVFYHWRNLASWEFGKFEQKVEISETEQKSFSPFRWNLQRPLADGTPCLAPAKERLVKSVSEDQGNEGPIRGPDQFHEFSWIVSIVCVNILSTWTYSKHLKRLAERWECCQIEAKPRMFQVSWHGEFHGDTPEWSIFIGFSMK